MKYAYPKISNTLSYQKIDPFSVKVTDRICDESYTFDIETVRFMVKLDGYTHPYKIPSALSRSERDDLIRFLDQSDLVRWSDVIHLSFGTWLKMLWIPKNSSLLWLTAYLSNALLIILWLPALIAGIWIFSSRIEDMTFDWFWIGYIIGILSGMFFHEVGHAWAAIAYSAPVYGMGIMLLCFVIPAAYVMLDRSRVKNSWYRVQINAAGVESNFLLCGIFLILAALLPSAGGVFICAAIMNALLGMINLSLIQGMDGSRIISDLLDIEDLVDRAVKAVFDRSARKRVLSQGACGYALLGMCTILLILQIAMPVFMITNVLEVIACFISF